MKDSTVETTGDEVLEIDPQAGDTETAGDPTTETPKIEKKTPVDEGPREMRRAMKEMREALKQTNESARFWMEQARSGGKKEAPAEDEPTTSVDLVEAITNGDTKAIAKAMREMGFVSAKDVAATVGATRREVTAEQKLIAKYPDLDDDQSEMFTRTAEVYNDLGRDPSMRNSPRLAELAAKLAHADLGGDPEPRKPARGRRADPDDVDEDEEQDRVERVARQAGDRGRRTASTATGNRDSDELDSMQKSIVAKLKAAGADISEDGYRKRAKAGVRMGGMPTRRR